MRVTFGQILRMLREQDEISLSAAARRVGSTYTTLYNWETDRSTPSMKAAYALAKLYGVKLDSILELAERNLVVSDDSDLIARLQREQLNDGDVSR